MNVYMAGRFPVDVSSLYKDENYVKDEYDAAKKQLEFLSSELSKICSKYDVEYEKIVVPFDGGKKLLLCYLEDKNVYFAKCDKNNISEIKKVFLASDTKKIADIVERTIYRANNIARMHSLGKRIIQSKEIEDIMTKNVMKKSFIEIEEENCYER